MVFHNFKLRSSSLICWCSGSVVECLTRDRGAGASHINPSLALVQPRKTCPFISERLLMGCKESNKNKTKKACTFSRTSYHSHDQDPIVVRNCETLPPPPPHLL